MGVPTRLSPPHAQRAGVLDAAYARTPERFVRHSPTPPPVPAAAWINKPDTKEAAHQIPDQSVSLGLTGSEPHLFGLGSSLLYAVRAVMITI